MTEKWKFQLFWWVVSLPSHQRSRGGGLCWRCYPASSSRAVLLTSRTCYVLRRGSKSKSNAKIPKKLGRQLFNHLKVYKGPDHPHQAQKPIPLPLKDKRIKMEKPSVYRR